MADETAENSSTRIIAVAHLKGGTGKTTTVCALAASLTALETNQKSGLKVCVIDLDPQGACSLHLGGEGPFQVGAYDAVISGKALKETSCKTQIDHCDLVPATPRLVLSEMDLASRSMSFDALATHLKNPSHGYDVILIDCPSGFGMISTMVMTIADLVVIPTPPVFFAVRALRETISYLNRLRRDASVFAAIVLTLFEADSSLHTMMAKKVRRDWGDLVVPTEIPREDSVEQAAMESKLLLRQFPGTASARAYEKLAGSLAFRLGLIDREPVPDVSVPPKLKEKPQVDAPPEADPPKLVVPEKRPTPESEKQTQATPEPEPVGKRPVAENLTPVKKDLAAPPTGGLPKFMKGLIVFMLVVVTTIVIYAAIQADMLAWVMLIYLILILIFFPILVFLLV